MKYQKQTLLGVLTAATIVLTACSAGSEPGHQDPAPSAPAAAAQENTAPAPSGEESATPTAPAKTSEASELAVSPNSFVPAVQVTDVRTGQEVDLSSVVPSDKPVLLWAWAPHCPSCRAEAGAVEAFAAAHQDKLTVVGIGTQDDLDYAKGFISDTGVETPQMLWDESFESWRAMGITAQPTMILVRGNGELIDGWVGGLPEETVLSLV